MGAITSQARFENRLPLVQRLLAAGINRHLRDSVSSAVVAFSNLSIQKRFTIHYVVGTKNSIKKCTSNPFLFCLM